MSIFDIFRKKKKLKARWSKYYTKDEINIKIPDISLYDQVLNSKNKYPDNIAYQYFNKKVKYKKFVKQIDKVAISFKKLNLKKGDIVTICLPNIPEALISFYALNKIGVIANMVHPLSAIEEIKESLIKTNSKYLIMLDMHYSKIKDTIKSTNVKKVIFTSPKDSMNIFMKIGYTLMQIGKYEKYPRNKFFMKFNKLYKHTYKSNITFKKYGKDTPCVILHSGGTSGTPKNVVLQNRAFILGARQEEIVLKRLKPGDCCLAIMPNFHGFGLSVTIHTPLALGCYAILIPQFNGKKFDTLFKKTRPTCVLGVPTIFEALISYKNEKNLDLSFLKYVVSGGDVLNKNLEDRINDYLKDHNCTAKIVQGYGLSEALAAVTLAFDDVNKSGSVGIPLPGNYIKIINTSTRNENPANVVGEICINSKALMMGYLNDDAETNEALQIHSDGHIWLHTGDLGYMDEDGFVFVKGRLKRMIITSGYNVYPSHIESVIEAHEAVLQCTVIGVPHPYKKEVPKAFIVLKDGYKGVFIKAQIRDYIRKNLAKYMIPKEIVFRKQLPKTKLGKVDFKKLESDIGEDDDE